MKAVVVEIRKNKAVLLSDDGCIVKVNNKNYELGQEVGMNMNIRSKVRSKLVAATAIAACLLLVFGGSAAAYYTPTAYVSLDVNPSIEYTLNMFNRVISVKGVNDDGTEIIKEIDLDDIKNKSISDAVTLTINEIAEAGYLNSEAAGIVITTSANSTEKADELAQDLEDTAKEVVEAKELEAVVEADAVGKKRVEEARELGVTPGKLNLVEKLKASADNPDSINIEEWLDKSVKDIMAQTKQYKEQNKDKAKDAEEDKDAQEQEKEQEDDKDAAADKNKEEKQKLEKDQKESKDQKQDKEKEEVKEANTNEASTDKDKKNNSSDNKDQKQNNGQNSDNSNKGSGKGKK